jgi:hypothetical protein
MHLLLLEGGLLVGLAVCVMVTSSWKIVKRPMLSPYGICDVVVGFRYASYWCSQC